MSLEAENSYDPAVTQHLKALYSPSRRCHACHAASPIELQAWQDRARPELLERLGLIRMQKELDGHQITATVGESEALDGYTRTLCALQTEPAVSLPFWMVRPSGKGPFPVAILPHGHDCRGWHTYAGLWPDAEQEERGLAEDRDVAIQAARRGFIALAPATRGIASDATIADIDSRHGKRDCRSHFMHCLLAGRTATGERVWDMMRLIDWLEGMTEADTSQVLVMGNSGGGMVTTYTGACDSRVTVSVASCSFSSYVRDDGRIQHCDCNAVPDILSFGEFWDVAGLIAPRAFLAVHGEQDSLFVRSDVDRCMQEVRRIYESADAADRFDCRFGSGGHRFYADLMWPFIIDALQP